MQRSTETFPFYSFCGSHFEIGRQYGEACRELIHKHRKQALGRLTNHLGKGAKQYLKGLTVKYQNYVVKYEKKFDDMILGVADGANISLEEAYLLQLRAEAYNYIETINECTTVAIAPEATSNGIGVIGQNADLPVFYSELCVVIECIPDDAPAYLMLTPAGQISYIGINEFGLGCFANFLTCDGWRVGFPRYLLSRLALRHRTVTEAAEAIEHVHRASSRNILMMDSYNQILNIETTAMRNIRMEATNGYLAHTNHYISEDLIEEERGDEAYYENSCVRYDQINRLLKEKHGQLSTDTMKTIFRDRNSHPHNISMMTGDSDTTDSITVASVIAEPSKREMQVAIGPPHLYEYKRYTLS